VELAHIGEGGGVGEPCDVFISYARENVELVRKIAQRIEDRHFSVWWDVTSIRAGQDFEAMIRRALNKVKCVLVVWTNESIHPDRRWVRAEAIIALSRDVLVPALLVDPQDVPLPFNTQSGIDLRAWMLGSDAAGIDRLLSEIEWRVRSAQTPSDLLQPSAGHLKDMVRNSAEANSELAGIVGEIGQTVPALRSHAATTALVQVDAVLDEVHATVRAVNEAVALFLKPALTGQPIDQSPDPYLDLASHDLSAVIAEGRGHCGDISRIYFGPDGVTWPMAPPTHPRSLRYLIHQNVTAATAARMDEVFLALNESDADLFLRMGALGHVLSKTSKDVVRLLAHARPADARALVVDAVEAVQPLQGELAANMTRIRQLQAEVRLFS
jgi:hypothetical protein